MGTTSSRFALVPTSVTPTQGGRVKLATLRNGHRDGALAVVSADNLRWIVTDTTLQAVLDQVKVPPRVR